ncbi:IS66 family insertion sequence element accessory protein TnpA [Stigmatella ashevillensis]|uniref:IS66 family insertion sequence element accessory protein TnpA n=1 Tax=Stigmatella ashevillensis TaxID=2995309 RepID=UPI004032F3F9
MRKHRLPRERLRFWSRRRGEWEQKEKPVMGFVPVEVAPAATSQREQVGGGAVVVEVKGVRMRVEGGASQELVERVLRALQQVQGC